MSLAIVGLGTLSIRNYVYIRKLVIMSFVIRNFVIMNFVTRNFVHVPLSVIKANM